MNNNLLPGFITLEDAIDLINSDTRSDAKVDIAFMVAGLPYLRVGGNFNIRLLEHKNGVPTYTGEKYVAIESEYQLAMLEHAIVEHYKKLSGDINFDPNNRTRSLSTAVDDEENPKANIVKQKKPMTKSGENIESHAISKTNGQ